MVRKKSLEKERPTITYWVLVPRLQGGQNRTCLSLKAYRPVNYSEAAGPLCKAKSRRPLGYQVVGMLYSTVERGIPDRDSHGKAT